MNKADLVDAIREKTGEPKNKIGAIIDAMADVVIEEVAGGNKVTLVGFGTFEPRERIARTGRNPKTGEPLDIPATTTPGFSAGKLFKNKVAGIENE